MSNAMITLCDRVVPEAAGKKEEHKMSIVTTPFRSRDSRQKWGNDVTLGLE